MRELDYLGYYLDEWREMFSYDSKTGAMCYLPLNKEMTDRYYTFRSSRHGGKAIRVSLARVAVMLVTDDYVSSDDHVINKDQDYFNLSYENLLVISKKAKRPVKDKVKAVETLVEGVFKIEPLGYFVVRRGPLQSAYCTRDFDDAVEVWLEWKEDNSISRVTKM